MKIQYVLILLVCIGAAVLMAGCKHKVEEQTPPEPEPICGGKVDTTDYDAPKEIQSEDLISFYIDFFKRGDYVYDEERAYTFKMTKENDVFVISEGADEALKCETDGDFAKRLEKLIRDNDIAKLNGTNKYTSGLPAEYGPYTLRAEYASGETLNIVVEGDPEDKWTSMVLDLFAKEFGNHGIDDLLPPEDDNIMTRFSLEYAYGDIRYLYCEVDYPVTDEEKEGDTDSGDNAYVTKASSSPWDRSGATEPLERTAEINEEYFESLQKIVEEVDLKSIQNGYSVPGGFDYAGTPRYYEFYIEYASGKCMNGFSDDPEECAIFKPIAEKFGAFYEEYLDKFDE